jgi:predicted O-linked N-acetylglucosamine transferase (SPINDLY family)
MNNEGRYVEKLIYMPRSFLCFHMFENIREVKINYKKRVDNKVCIGIMNKLQKHHNEVRKVWREILLENENVLLYIKKDESKNIELEEFYKDFPRDRIVFLPFSNTLERYLDQFNEIDFCIDTYPYSGTTTTCTSLYMGVPIFTIYKEGANHVSNVTGSILNNMGMEEYMSDTLEGYKEKINEYIKKGVVHGNEERELLKGKFLELMNPRRFMEEYEEILESLESSVVEIEDDEDEEDVKGNDMTQDVIRKMSVMRYI